MATKKLLIVTLVLSLSSLSACGDDNVKYFVQMCLRDDKGSVVTLTSENPNLELSEISDEITRSVKVYNFYIGRYDENRKTNVVVETIYPWPNVNDYIGDTPQILDDNGDSLRINIVPEYKIIESDGNERDGVKKIGADYNQNRNDVTLESVVGKHILKYKFPAIKKYGIEETVFTISYNVVKSTKPDMVELHAVSNGDVSFTKKEASSDEEYDIYYVEGTKMPKFSARLKDDGLTELDLVGNERIVLFYYVPGSGVQEHYIENSKKLPSGAYLCEVVFTASERYRSVKYTCYIVLADNE